MAIPASENEDCVLCFTIFCQKTTSFVQNKIIHAKMIYINTKIKKLLPQSRIEFLAVQNKTCLMKFLTVQKTTFPDLLHENFHTMKSETRIFFRMAQPTL